MLVLTRKEGETIRVGDDIEIVVRRVSGNRVTIAVDAPRDIRILRGELQQFDDAPASTPSRKRAPQQVPERSRQQYAIFQDRVPRSAALPRVDATCDTAVG